MHELKGKFASSTEKRRIVWEEIIWPLILEKDRPYFTIEEYHKKRDKYSKENNINLKIITGGFVSLIVKGLIIKDKDPDVYYIHYKLIPYLRKKTVLSYGQAAREVTVK
ncbi:MAG: hypothetical protein KatS3mg003_0832 [Candidatus Nitrosocaldaceae archaeon]|nr:MAG: hypothetical protein KatS3mg003_0832 [Candidatus Nitrosocaldaceae archaeon]